MSESSPKSCCPGESDETFLSIEATEEQIKEIKDRKKNKTELKKKIKYLLYEEFCGESETWSWRKYPYKNIPKPLGIGDWPTHVVRPKTHKSKKALEAIPHSRKPICFGGTLRRRTAMSGVGHKKLGLCWDRFNESKLMHHIDAPHNERSKLQCWVSTWNEILGQCGGLARLAENTKRRSIRWRERRPFDP